MPDTPLSLRDHWSHVYQTKGEDEVSWFQETPASSLKMIRATGLGPEASVLDVGGGASRLVDALLDDGYRHVGVLDVAPEALATARTRLAERASAAEWFAADVLTFESPHPWDLWHDRAVFHFLTDPDGRARYRDVLLRTLAPGGHVVTARFGPGGPERCSGLPVQRYDAEALAAALGPELRLAEHRIEAHSAPTGAEQEFLFARFVRVWPSLSPSTPPVLPPRP
jgi:SAM-dependent methyltransferase